MVCLDSDSDEAGALCRPSTSSAPFPPTPPRYKRKTYKVPVDGPNYVFVDGMKCMTRAEVEASDTRAYGLVRVEKPNKMRGWLYVWKDSVVDRRCNRHGTVAPLMRQKEIQSTM